MELALQINCLVLSHCSLNTISSITAVWGFNEIGPITVYILNEQKSATFDGISTKFLPGSGPSIKLLIGGLIRDAPDPLTPPMGGPKYFFGG